MCLIINNIQHNYIIHHITIIVLLLNIHIAIATFRNNMKYTSISIVGRHENGNS